MKIRISVNWYAPNSGVDIFVTTLEFVRPVLEALFSNHGIRSILLEIIP
jgi:hypothetical protein